MSAENIAAQAESLMTNEAFTLALDNLRAGALEALARTQPTDIEAIRTQQATVRVVDELRGDLEAFIRSGKPKTPSGIA